MSRVDRCALEERAAIMEFDAGMSRQDAEREAARLHGFENWKQAMDATKREEARCQFCRLQIK